MLTLPLRTSSESVFKLLDNPLSPVPKYPAAAPQRAEARIAANRLGRFSPFYDASFLFRHMEALGIDRDRLAGEDPLLFRELQGLCALCRSKVQCGEELAFTHNMIVRENWEMYCPNARTLNILGTLQNCGRAAQHLRWPKSADEASRPIAPDGCRGLS